MMVIHVEIDATAPPVGSVHVLGGVPRPFAGWLGLLRALSDLLEEESGRIS